MLGRFTNHQGRIQYDGDGVFRCHSIQLIKQMAYGQLSHFVAWLGDGGQGRFDHS